MHTYFECKQNVYHVCTFRAIVFGYSSVAMQESLLYGGYISIAKTSFCTYVVLTCKSSAINKVLFAPT